MKLHGAPLSNFYNMVKHALLEKNIAFEEVLTPPSQEPEFLAKSPMGKVPLLETDEGFLTETPAIMDYLELRYPEIKLFPDDAFARAKVIQLMRVIELYVEGPVHKLVGVLFGREIPDYVKEKARPESERGLAALQRIIKLSPFVAGEAFTYADIVAFHSFTLGNRLTQQIYDWDMMGEVPGLTEWYGRVSERDSTRRILVDMAKSMEN